MCYGERRDDVLGPCARRGLWGWELGRGRLEVRLELVMVLMLMLMLVWVSALVMKDQAFSGQR